MFPFCSRVSRQVRNDVRGEGIGPYDREGALRRAHGLRGEFAGDVSAKTGWQAGDPIEIEAMIGSKRYRDKGQIVQVQPQRLLQYTYWSSVSGLPDRPESYSTVTMTLEADGAKTILTVEQTVPPSPVRKGPDWEIGEESGAKHVAFYWRMTLPALKRVVEEARGAS